MLSSFPPNRPWGMAPSSSPMHPACSSALCNPVRSSQPCYNPRPFPARPRRAGKITRLTEKAGSVWKDVCLPEQSFGHTLPASLSCAFKGSRDVEGSSSEQSQNFPHCLSLGSEQQSEPLCSTERERDRQRETLIHTYTHTRTHTSR